MRLKLVSTLSTTLLSVSAFAQTAVQAPAVTAPGVEQDKTTPASTPAQVDAATAKKVEAYGLIYGNLNLYTTEDVKPPHVGSPIEVARIGLKVSEGIAKGQVELQSNKIGSNKIGPVYAADTRSEGGAGAFKDNRSIGVRRAEVGLDFASKTGFRVGRTRPGGANAYYAEPNTVPDGYGFVDGVQLTQEVALGGKDTNKVTIGATYGNGLSVPQAGKDEIFQTAAETNSRALVGKLDVAYESVHLVALYGMQSKQRVGYAGDEIQGKGVAGVTPSTKLTADRFADASHTETSLGYETDALSFGGFYQNISYGKMSDGKVTPSGKIILGDTSADVQEIKNETFSSTAYGIGVMGDGTLLGAKDMLQKGDTLTWGFGVGMQQKRTGASSAAEKDKDTLEVAVSTGYKISDMFVSVGLVHKASKAKQFSNETEQSSNTLVSNFQYAF